VKQLKCVQLFMLGVWSICWAMPAWAVDSYRYLHVNIETPWSIFVFLFFLVFAPMILLVVLHWYNAFKKDKKDEHDENNDD